MNRILISLFALLSVPAIGQINDSAGNIYVSYDNGASWARSDAGFPAKEGINAWVNKESLLLAATNSHGVMISADKGKSWSVSRKGLPPSVRVTTLLASSDLIFAGTFQHGIYTSSDNGSSWQPFNTGVENFTIRTFHSDKHQSILAGTNDGVYKLDAGKWIKLGGEYQVNDIVSDNEYVYVATHLGVVRTADGGRHWQNVYTGGISKLSVAMHQIILLDYHGAVHYGNDQQMVWFKDEPYFPIKHYYQVTPGSQKLLIPPYGKRTISIEGPAYGLPPKAGVNKLLQTPFGVFASLMMEGC